MKDKEVKIENINTNINFYGEQIDIELNSDFNSFVNNICKIINIPSDNYKSLEISYKDEDGDNIILSTEEDYILFFQQLKDKTVNGIIVEVKEDSNINPIECFDSALDYKEKIDLANIQILNENNNLNKDIEKDNNINNINDYMEGNFDNKDNNLILNNEPEKDIPIDDLIFNQFGCESCQTYPIICILYYCPQCQMNICENCIKNFGNHQHEFLKFESYQEFLKIKEKEKANQINNNNPNFNNNFPNINNNFINNNNRNNNKFINNKRNNKNYKYPFSNPFLLIKDNQFKERWKDRRKKGPFYFGKKVYEYKRIIKRARKTYNLKGINDKQLLDSLFKTNGNIDQAIILLTKKI